MVFCGEISTDFIGVSEVFSIGFVTTGDNVVDVAATVEDDCGGEEEVWGGAALDGEVTIDDGTEVEDVGLEMVGDLTELVVGVATGILGVTLLLPGATGGGDELIFAVTATNGAFPVICDVGCVEEGTCDDDNCGSVFCKICN